jgi:hypothetical protein
MRIAVAGGSGCAGRFAVGEVRAAGHQPVVIARPAGAGITAGPGLDDALAGTLALIDVSNISTVGRSRPVAFFEAATRNLLAAGGQAGVSHPVVLPVVGAGRAGTGYYEGKRRQESLVLPGAVPASVQRATQFHEFAAQVLRRARGPLALVPRMPAQPAAAREVAQALLALAVGPPAGMAPELAVPGQPGLTELARRVLRARRSRRIVVPVRLPGAAGRAVTSGGLPPDRPGPRGRQRFRQWLAGPGGACATRGRGPERGPGHP